MTLTISVHFDAGSLQLIFAGLGVMFGAGSFVLQCLTYKRNKN